MGEEVTENHAEKVERLRAVIAGRRAAKPVQLRNTPPPHFHKPRYNDVFFRGLEELEQQDREHGLLPVDEVVELRLVPVETERRAANRFAVVMDLVSTIAGDSSADETSRWRAVTALSIMEGAWNG